MSKICKWAQISIAYNTLQKEKKKIVQNVKNLQQVQINLFATSFTMFSRLFINKVSITSWYLKGFGMYIKMQQVLVWKEPHIFKTKECKLVNVMIKNWSMKKVV